MNVEDSECTSTGQKGMKLEESMLLLTFESAALEIDGKLKKNNTNKSTDKNKLRFGCQSNKRQSGASRESETPTQHT